MWCSICGSDKHDVEECWFVDPLCEGCGRIGHLSLVCPYTDSSGSDESICNVCGSENHEAYYCRFKNCICTSCGKVGHLPEMCPYEEDEESDVSVCYVCGSENHEDFQCRYRNRACFDCGEVGHLRIMCPYKEEDEEEEEYEEEEECEEEEEEDEFCEICGTCGHQKSQCRYRDTAFCKYCKRDGHLKPMCPEIRKFAQFECESCDKVWTSAFAWIGFGQYCHECVIEVMPFRYLPLRKNPRFSGKRHIQRLCGKCIYLGYKCVKEDTN